MNNWQINTLNSFGNTISDIGKIGANAYVNASKTYKAITDNQLNAVYSAVEKSLNSDMNTYCNTITEDKLQDIRGNLKKDIWDNTINVDKLKALTGGQFSDKLYDEAIKNLKSNDSEVYRNFAQNAEIIATSSDMQYLGQLFEQTATSALSKRDENNNYTWIGKDAVESANNLKNIYNELTIDNDTKNNVSVKKNTSFVGFDTINRDGRYNSNGTDGKRILAQTGTALYTQKLIEDNAKKGPMYGISELNNDIDSYGKDFCNAIGLTDEETEAYLTQCKEVGVQALQAEQKNAEAIAGQGANKYISLVNEKVKNAGIKLNDLTLKDIVKLADSTSLSDRDLNYYSKAQFDKIISDFIKTDISNESIEYAQKYEQWKSGIGFEDKLLPTIDSITSKTVNQGYSTLTTFNPTASDMYATGETVTTTTTTRIKGEEVAKTVISDPLPTEFKKDFENEYGKTLEDMFIENGEYNPSITTYYGSEVNQICDALGITDSFGKYQIAKQLEADVSYNLGKNGKFGQVYTELESAINNKNISENDYASTVNYYKELGYINESQAKYFIARKEYPYKEELNALWRELESDKYVGSKYTSLAKNRKTFQNYAMAQLDAVKGDYTQDTVATVSRYIQNSFSDEFQYNYTKELERVLDEDKFIKDILNDSEDSYYLKDIEQNYLMGNYDGLGFNEFVPRVVSEIESKSIQGTEGLKANDMLQSIWDQMGYDGTYKDAEKKGNKKDYDPRTEVVERCFMSGVAMYAREKQLQNAIGDSLGKDTKSCIFLNDSIGTVARVSDKGIVVFSLPGTGSPTYEVAKLTDDAKERMSKAEKGFVIRPSDITENNKQISPTETKKTQQNADAKNAVDGYNSNLIGNYGKVNKTINGATVYQQNATRMPAQVNKFKLIFDDKTKEVYIYVYSNSDNGKDNYVSIENESMYKNDNGFKAIKEYIQYNLSIKEEEVPTNKLVGFSDYDNFIKEFGV